MADNIKECLKSKDELLRACRGCLATNIDLHNLYEIKLAEAFGEFTGVAVHQSDGYPQFLCPMCLYLLRKFCKYRARCHASMWMLQEISVSRNTVNVHSIEALDRSNLKYNLHRTKILHIDTIDEDSEMSSSSMIEDYFNKSYDINDSGDYEGDDGDNDGNDDNNDDEMENETEVQEKAELIEELVDDKDMIEKHNKQIKLTKETMKIDFTIKEENGYSNDPIIESEDATNKKYMNLLETMKKSIPTDTSRYFLKNTAVKRVIKDNEVIKGDYVIKDEEIIKDKVIKDKKVRKQKRANKWNGVSIFNRKADTEDMSDSEEDIGDDWRTIIKEINEEHNNDKVTKRKFLSKVDIQFLIKKAKKISKAYNVEVKFLTKEELCLEREQRRLTDRFLKSRIKCDLCCQVFTRKETYERHMVNHDPRSGDIECEICFKRFPIRHRYLIHFSTMHSKRISCKQCGIKLNSWKEAKTHYMWHQGQYVNISCDICGMMFTRKKNFLNHLHSAHPDSGKLQCALCERTFISKHGVMAHMYRVHPRKATCASCEGVFACPEALAAHLETPGRCQQGISSCPECGRNFTDETLMKDHLKKEHKKLHTCEVCNKKFDNQEKYKSHMIHHNNRGEGLAFRKPRNIVCEICGKRERCLALLRIHQRVHTGEEPYRCDLCHKTFRNKRCHTSHMETHTTERKYQCPLCPKAFKRASHKKTHLLTHSQERPYPCPSCPKRFASGYTLKEHMNVVHLGLPRSRIRKRGLPKTKLS